MSGCIYLITHKESGKKYVGQHCKPDPKKRWNAHITSRMNYPFTQSLRKYGKDNFTWEVLRVFPLASLNIMEAYYAEIFESYIWQHGYNVLMCGEGFSRINTAHTPETKAKISMSLTNKKKSASHILNMRQKRTTPTCNKMRQARLNYLKNKFLLTL